MITDLKKKINPHPKCLTETAWHHTIEKTLTFEKKRDRFKGNKQ
jgi:hypothetical protein